MAFGEAIEQTLKASRSKVEWRNYRDNENKLLKKKRKQLYLCFVGQFLECW